VQCAWGNLVTGSEALPSLLVQLSGGAMSIIVSTSDTFMMSIFYIVVSGKLLLAK
jgi:hypothetical protein